MNRQMGFTVIHAVNNEIKIDLVKAIKFIDPLTIEVTIADDVVVKIDGLNNLLQEFTCKYDMNAKSILTYDVVQYKENYYTVAFVDSTFSIVNENLEQNIILTERVAMQCKKVGNVIQNSELVAPPKGKEMLEKNESTIG